MTAIIYFSEMLVASLLAILLLAISHFRMSLDAVLFVGGVVGWTLAEYFVHRFVLHGLAPIQHGLHHANPDEAVLTIFWHTVHERQPRLKNTGRNLPFPRNNLLDLFAVRPQRPGLGQAAHPTRVWNASTRGVGSPQGHQPGAAHSLPRWFWAADKALA
jgi:hypothetical protein